MLCPNCKTESGPSLFCYVCDAYLPSMSDGVKASIPSRLGAYLLDATVLLILLVVLGLIAIGVGINVNSLYHDHGLEVFLGVFFGGWFCYFLIFFRLLARGQTPGKWFLDIRAVEKRNGAEPGLGRMLLRETLGKWVSGCFFGLGWFWAIWDRDAQAWHDKIVRTVVLYRNTESSKSPALAFLFGVLVISGFFAWASFAHPFKGRLPVAGEESVPPKNILQGTPAVSARASVLGFHYGEGLTDVSRRAKAMGFGPAGCHPSTRYTGEVDCEFSSRTGNSMLASFYQGELESVSILCSQNIYHSVEEAIEREHGSPSADEHGTLNWGSVADGFSASLVNRNNEGVLEVQFWNR